MPKLLQCPLCGKEKYSLLKEWNYSAFHVQNMQCLSCQKTFKVYFKNGRYSHTIINGCKKLAYDEYRVINYMEENGDVTVDKLSQALSLNPDTVEAILKKLEKLGQVIKLL